MLTVAVGPISLAEKTDCARRMMERKSDEEDIFLEAPWRKFNDRQYSGEEKMTVEIQTQGTTDIR